MVVTHAAACTSMTPDANAVILAYKTACLMISTLLCMQMLQDYMQKLELPVTTIYPSAFLENFFKYTVFMKQADGTIFWSSNQSTEKKPWHSCHATGTAVQGGLVCRCTVSCFWQCKRLAVLVHACCSVKLDACMSQYTSVMYVR